MLSVARLQNDYDDEVKDTSCVGMDDIDVGGCETGSGNRNISPSAVAALMIDEPRGTDIMAGLAGLRQPAAAQVRSSVPHLSSSRSPSPTTAHGGGGGGGVNAGRSRSSGSRPLHAVATMVDL